MQTNAPASTKVWPTKRTDWIHRTVSPSSDIIPLTHSSFCSGRLRNGSRCLRALHRRPMHEQLASSANGPEHFSRTGRSSARVHVQSIQEETRPTDRLPSPTSLPANALRTKQCLALSDEPGVQRSAAVRRANLAGLYGHKGRLSCEQSPNVNVILLTFSE